MSNWVRWTLPVAAVAAVASPAYAVIYMSLGGAQKAAFPSATNFVDHDGRSWKAMAGDRLLGLVVLDHVIGKHLFIDYMVAFDTTGRVTKVDILQYREILWRRGQGDRLARPIRRQDQRQRAAGRQRYQKHLRRDLVVAPPHRRHQEIAGHLWRQRPIASCRGTREHDGRVR